jgi:hypothetical protein
MFLRNQISEIESQGSIKVIALETKLEFSKNISGIEVKFKGNADRIDSIGDATRIIDYKTGKSEKFDIKELNYEVFTNKTSSKKLQLMMYGWLYRNMNPDCQQLSSGIYWLKNNINQFEALSIGKDFLISDEYLNEFEKVLGEIVTEILDEKTPFIMTADEKVCGYCDYKNICNRN